MGAYAVARLLWCLWWAVVKPPCCARQPVTTRFILTPTSTAPRPPLFAFAQSLFTAGEYYRAIGEFQRFLFFQPEHPLACGGPTDDRPGVFLRGALATSV